jgi:hypothetical protein
VASPASFNVPTIEYVVHGTGSADAVSTRTSAHTGTRNNMAMDER